MNYYAKVNAVKKIPAGTQLIVTVDENVLSKLNKDHDVELVLRDKRLIGADQRKKIYATVRDIALHIGDVPEYIKEIFKINYCIENNEEYFSLSNCSVGTAREFINYLMEYVIREGVQLNNDIGVNRTDDIDKYLYYCIKYRKCAITGKDGADIHHCAGSVVGMGNNRQKMNHVNSELIALSREWHNKVHQQGEKLIFDKYKIYGIKVDVQTLRGLGINAEDVN